MSAQEQETIKAIGSVIEAYTETERERAWIGFWNKCTAVASIGVIILAACVDIKAAIEEEAGAASIYSLPPGLVTICALITSVVGVGYHFFPQRKKINLLKTREEKATKAFRGYMRSGSNKKDKVKGQRKDVVSYVLQLALNGIIERKIEAKERLRSFVIRVGKILSFAVMAGHFSLALKNWQVISVQYPGLLGYDFFKKMGETNHFYEYTVTVLGLMLGILFIAIGSTQFIKPKIAELRKRLVKIPVVVDSALPELYESIRRSGLDESGLKIALPCG